MINCINDNNFEVMIGGKMMPVVVQRKRMKHMYLRVKDNKIFINCSYAFSKDDIIRFIYEKESWIIDALLTNKKHESMNKEGVDGPIVYWFGEKKFVRYIIAPRNSMTIDGDILTFYLKEDTKENIEKTFRKYANQALMDIVNQERVQWDFLICDRYNIPYPTISMRYMTGKWGVNHINKGKIYLSTRLIHYPKEGLYYVLLHEYVHFLVPDHSKRFYRYVREYMPQYKEYDKLLK